MLEISRLTSDEAEAVHHCYRATANRAPENLDELLNILRAGAIWPGCPMECGGLDATELPTFGGPDVEDTLEVWSWDAERLIVGTCSDDFEIVQRAEW